MGPHPWEAPHCCSVMTEISSILGKLVLYVEPTQALQESHVTQVMPFDLRILNFSINNK